MKHHLVSLMTGLLIAGVAVGTYSPATLAAEKTQAAEQQRAYGYELMTEQERAEHRTKMRNLKTEKEREQYRIEHHKKMQERAKERGVTLPDEPMPRGRGMGGGQGGGQGGGMGGGQGGGMGGGQGGGMGGGQGGGMGGGARP